MCSICSEPFSVSAFFVLYLVSTSHVSLGKFPHVTSKVKPLHETSDALEIADAQSQKRKAQVQQNTMQKKMVKDPQQARVSGQYESSLR
jgi:uncharacterized membrane protein